QRAVGQWSRGAGERAGEGAVGTGVVVDADGEAFAGRGQFEVEGDIDVGERRHVEMFGRAQAEGFGALPGATGAEGVGAEHVGLHFAKGVGDLGDAGDAGAGGVVNKVERHRVEQV